ncbi:tetratricopeptide repeat protein [Dactylosporangium sp. CS-033363]|uniref:tetratricopeptide repeat protein n=1 Tax=Dactylosporangium sp. CS-033363 TaxID=3239935 RepID=UPI003D8E9FDA
MTAPTDRVILQDLRNCTVRIRTLDGAAVVGTGIIVSRDGLVITCAHVLRAAAVDPAELGASVTVDIPRRQDRPGWSAVARVVWYPDGFDDDIVCLRLRGRVDLPADRVAALGSAHDSQDNRFRSYGFRRLQKYLGGIADGLILGEVEPPEEAVALTDPVQLRSTQINAGMSGSPVLDTVRNLIVGVVSETWIPDTTGKDSETAWAVDARVIGFSRLGIDLSDHPLPLRRAEPPVFDEALARQAVPVPGHRLADAPSVVTDWVGREDLIGLFDEAWEGRRILVVGMIGFGGEGKSSVARRWIDTVIERGDDVAGIFWWSFTERPSTDEFLSAAVEFLSGGRLRPADVGGEAGSRAAVVAGVMQQRRYLFVLDGLEALQYERGDQYGSVTSQELYDFLRFAATPGHQSFCLLTSRVPALDLAAYSTYQHLAIVPLSVAEGRDLLRKLGVIGPDASLEQLAADWGGHALTLTLVAAYLQRRYAGDPRRIGSLPPPGSGLSEGERVRRILREYDDLLAEEERQVLVRCSLFRGPVEDDALRAVLGLAGDDAGWDRTVARTLLYLEVARVLRRDSRSRLMLHPLVRDFYQAHGSREEHELAFAYYRSALAPAPASLDDLEPAIEAVHHACRAGRYDEACDIAYDHVYLGDRALVTSELNAYEAALSMFTGFFPGGDVHAEPLLTDPESRGWLLHEVAACLQMLGRLREAASMFRRASAAFVDLGSWHEAAVSCQNVTELYLHLGALTSCRRLIPEAFDLAERAADKEDELVAETLRGALAHIEGRSTEAEAAFGHALRIATAHTPIPALYSSSGTRYAEHLMRAGRSAEALAVLRRNVEICRTAGWLADVARSHVGIGDLHVAAGDLDEARAAYDEALRVARGITRRDVLVAALLGRSRFDIATGDRGESLTHAVHALHLAIIGGYRLYEVDARIVLAQLRAHAGDPEAARAELTQAQEISIEIGYYWGEHDAAAAATVIDRLRRAG